MYPNTFYRVSVKALIRNAEGNVLVVKENQDTWSLPGGGLDHGELPESGVRRELKEELGLTNIAIQGVRRTITFELKAKRAWLLWIVYDITIDTNDFTFGEGITEVDFINPQVLASSDDIFEQLAHKAATSYP